MLRDLKLDGHPVSAVLFDWGDTLMHDDPAQTGPMAGWPSVSALPDALATLQWIREHALVCIASGAADSDSEAIRAALARVGLAEVIGQIFCRRELGTGKDDPMFWQAIASSLRLPPQQIVMVGDSYEADVLAARKAGINAIWFNWRQRPARPCPTITALRELPGLLNPA